jgi:hypothetical protein
MSTETVGFFPSNIVATAASLPSLGDTASIPLWTLLESILGLVLALLFGYGIKEFICYFQNNLFGCHRICYIIYLQFHIFLLRG